MGWLGPRPLAASALGINLTFAVQPASRSAWSRAVLADDGDRARRQDSSSVRDVRRTFRQSLWLVRHRDRAGVADAVERRADHPRARPGAGAGPRRRAFPPAATCGRCCRFLLFQAMRNFLVGARAAGLGAGDQRAGIVAQRAARLGADLRPFRLAGARAFSAAGSAARSSGPCSTLGARRRHPDRPAVPPLPPVRPLLAARLAAATGTCWRLGLPIGLRWGSKAAVFSAAAYLMGLIDADSVAAHAVALQIAALTFMVPWGSARRRRSASAGRSARGDRAGIARAGWTAWAARRRLHGAMALVMWAVPRDADHPVPRRQAAAMRGSIALGVSVPRRRRRVPDRRRRAGRRRRHAARPSRHARADAVRLVGYWVVGLGVGAWLAFWRRLAGRRHLDRPGQSASAWSRC